MLHIEMGQARLFREALRRQEISVSIARGSRDLDVALAGQTFEVEISQAERDTKFGGKNTLRGPAISIELAEEQKVPLSL
jgi:hypothetical protein